MTNKKNQLSSSSSHIFLHKRAVLMGLLLMTIASLCGSVQAINCSVVNCVSTDQTIINGENMFDETNFNAVVDGFGRTRQFYVHIPASYDTLAVDRKMPLIFAFHGGGQDRNAMINGKWGDHFDQETAFVIPLAETGPCDTSPNPERKWMGPNVGPGVPVGIAVPPNCTAATQKTDIFGNPMTYWNASLSGTFTDVLFIEQVRRMMLDRFPKLNATKVYATGFSSGGGMTNTLLCYRSGYYRGFSVAAKTIYGDSGRGDYNNNGVEETDVNSLVATCGKSHFDPGHATGISYPQIWGEGFALPGVLYQRTNPVILFVGDQDTLYTIDDINDTGVEIRRRNNLNGGFSLTNPFMNIENDDAETQRRIFDTAADPAKSHSTFSRYYVQKINDGVGAIRNSAGHAMPDAQECPTALVEKMTCDYSYTDRTMIFFQTFAELNLIP